MAQQAKNTICLWYDGGAEEAAQFYAQTFPDSSVGASHRAPGDYPSGKKGDVLLVEFTVMGLPCIGLNGGPEFKHNEAFSFQVLTADQAETDRYWNAIVGNGGQESACGWCKDKWGVSWQITPRVLMKAFTDPDPVAAKRVFDTMMHMKKIDVAAIEAAYRGWLVASATSEFKSSVGIVMIMVPAGSFTMGSPKSEDGHRAWEQRREVTFASDFFLAKTPVTQDQFAAVTGTNPTVHEKIGDAPVDSVDWNRANEYCQKLTQLDRAAGALPNDWEYRLPTEAEWEYACRAGSSSPRHGEPQDVAWHYDNADDKPHAVGQKTPNAWGFHDMLGNVWEWCQDWFVANSSRSVRGGSYFNSARFCRAAQRWGWIPNNPGRYCGFRLLAARAGSFDVSPPIDDFPTQARPPSIFDAIDANDIDLALRVITADPAAVESVDGIPPPLHDCIYTDRPQWLEWLLDHGADIERREQDYGSTPLSTAVVHRHKTIIRILVQRGADATRAMHFAQRGLAGDFEADPRLDREGYRAIVELLQTLGVEE